MAHQKNNWPELLKQFKDSGLSQAAFCKKHNLNRTYFNLKLSQSKAPTRSSFSKVRVDDNVLLTPSQGLMLEVGNCKIHCPAAMPTPLLITLVKSLA